MCTQCCLWRGIERYDAESRHALQVNGTEEGDHVWQTSADPQDGQYHMIVQDDGTMAIFHGTDPEHNRGLLRRMRPHKRKKKKKSEGRR